MNVGSLFAGIGGFDLGLGRAGMRTVWFCEQDPYCQRVLARHWPGVPCYSDVRSLVADAASVSRSSEQGVDHQGGSLVCAVSGASGGVGGGDVAPRGAIAGRTEVSGREGDVRGQVPVQVPQVDVLCGGFPCQDLSVAGKGAGLDGERSGLWFEYARLIGELRPRYVIVENVPALLARGFGRVLGDLAALGYDAEWDCLPASAFGAPHQRDRVWIVAYPQELFSDGSDDHAQGRGEGTRTVPEPRDSRSDQRAGGSWWATEPDVGRVAHGVPDRVDRLSALGNALVPQIAEWIGRRILEWEGVTV